MKAKKTRVGDGLKGVLVGFVAFAALAALIYFAVLMVRGTVWAADKALPWLLSASEIAILVCLFVLAPLCLFKKARPVAGFAFYVVSFLFGAMLFAYCCLFIVYTWGYGALIVGLLFAGVGVFPVALLAALIHLEGWVVLDLLLGLLLTFGTRFLGVYLISPKEEERVAAVIQELAESDDPFSADGLRES
jgi:hypothetical protein